jgi:hypothetical protein
MMSKKVNGVWGNAPRNEIEIDALRNKWIIHWVYNPINLIKKILPNFEIKHPKFL